LTIIIYVRNIFGLAAMETSHPSMMETCRATTSAVPPTADIVGHRGHVRQVPRGDIARREALLSSLEHVQGETIGVNLAVEVGPKAIHLVALDIFNGHQWPS
jgi:hypothetical protein